MVLARQSLKVTARLQPNLKCRSDVQSLPYALLQLLEIRLLSVRQAAFRACRTYLLALLGAKHFQAIMQLKASAGH